MPDLADTALFYLAAGIGMAGTILYTWRTGLVWAAINRPERASRLAITGVLLSVINGLLDQARHQPPPPFLPRHVLVLAALVGFLVAKVYMFPLVLDLFRARRQANPSHKKEGRA